MNHSGCPRKKNCKDKVQSFQVNKKYSCNMKPVLNSQMNTWLLNAVFISANLNVAIRRYCYCSKISQNANCDTFFIFPECDTGFIDLDESNSIAMEISGNYIFSTLHFHQILQFALNKLHGDYRNKHVQY